MYNSLPYGAILYNQPGEVPVEGAASLTASSGTTCSVHLKAAGSCLLVGGGLVSTGGVVCASGTGTLTGLVDLSAVVLKLLSGGCDQRAFASMFSTASLLAAGKTKAIVTVLLGCDGWLLRWSLDLPGKVDWSEHVHPEVMWESVSEPNTLWKTKVAA